MRRINIFFRKTLVFIHEINEKKTLARHMSQNIQYKRRKFKIKHNYYQ